MSEDDRERLERQLAALQAWIGDLSTENRGLRRMLDDCQGRRPKQEAQAVAV